MNALPELDMSLAAMTPGVEIVEPPSDPWLERRTHAFGASEVATLLVALGRRPPEILPSYLLPDLHVTTRTAGEPRIFAQKAGLVRARKVGRAAEIGTAREQELLEQWRQLIAHGQADEAASLIDPTTVQHSSAIPRELWPLVDRHCPRLAASLDAWARDWLGGLVAADCKCSVRPYEQAKPHQVLQVQAQLAVTGAEYGVLIEGQGWAREDTGGHGPIKTWPVERDDDVISEIREACRAAWARVAALRVLAERKAA